MVVTVQGSPQPALPDHAVKLQLGNGSMPHLELLEVLRHQQQQQQQQQQPGAQWLLWGTPATLVMRSNLERLLAAYDPGLPYLIFDQPGPRSPACLPCHWQRNRSSAEPGDLQLPPGFMSPGALAIWMAARS